MKFHVATPHSYEIVSLPISTVSRDNKNI